MGQQAQKAGLGFGGGAAGGVGRTAGPGNAPQGLGVGAVQPT